jgi:hypothetical protein
MESAQVRGDSVMLPHCVPARTRYCYAPLLPGRKKILVHGYPLEVVGVARDGFDGITGSPVDLWTPVSMVTQIDPDGGTRVSMFGWLKETPKRLWHGGALRCIGVAITCVGDLSGTNGAHMVHY